MVPEILGRVDRILVGQGDNDLAAIVTHKVKKDLGGSSVATIISLKSVS